MFLKLFFILKNITLLFFIIFFYNLNVLILIIKKIIKIYYIFLKYNSLENFSKNRKARNFIIESLVGLFFKIFFYLKKD
jgi:hypothetical protein